MICKNCGYPNPNGYVGLCRNCRTPLDVTPKPVAKKTQEKAKTAKIAKTAKTAKKAKTTKKA